MDTKVLEEQLKKLDEKTISLGKEVQRLRKEGSQYQCMAENYTVKAQSLFRTISNAGEDEDTSSIYETANEYMEQAIRCEELAQECEEQEKEKVVALRECRCAYESYQEEGQTNLANLEITVNKLKTMTGSQYGAGKIKEALTLAQHKVVYNDNLVKGCQKRMLWIDQICGESAEPYQKVLKRY